MKTYLHGPTEAARSWKLRFGIGDLDLPKGMKSYASSREEEEVDAHICPCAKPKRAELLNLQNVHYSRRNGTC